MNEAQLKRIIQSGIQNAMGYVGGELTAQRADALDYYLREPFGNEVSGRSQVISSDVQDTIEWIMPSLMRTFFGSDQVVKFDPVGEEDEDQADQETDTVNHVFLKENNGFLIGYTFIKDALLQKNGILKIHWEDGEKTTKQRLDGLSDVELAYVLEQGGEIVEQDSHVESLEMDGYLVEQEVFDVVIEKTEDNGRVSIENVPPEEFGISRWHNSLDLEDADFLYHRTEPTRGELLGMGLDREKINVLPLASEIDTEEEIAREHLVDEQQDLGNMYNDWSMERVTVYECYVRSDMNGDGKSELIKVLAGGTSYEILDQEEVDSIPFVAITPIILSHKFHGLSVAETVMDLQEIKSYIWRQSLDNLSIANNQRIAANERVNLDDLLTSRPWGVVQIEGEGPIGDSISAIPFQPVLDQALSMIEYTDRVGTGRSGVNQASQSVTDLLSNNKGDLSVQAVMSAAEARIELIARAFAETGFTWLFRKIHGDLIKHFPENRELSLKLSNKWTPVKPSEWKERTNTTVNVGLGTGDRMQQLVGIQKVLETQEKLHLNGMGHLSPPEKIYKALKDLTDMTGLKTEYFVSPESDEAKQYMQLMAQNQPKDPSQDLIQMQGQIEGMKNQTNQMKLHVEQQTKMAEMAQKQDELQTKQQLEYEKLENDFAVKMEGIAAQLTELELKYNTDVPGAKV